MFGLTKKTDRQAKNTAELKIEVQAAPAPHVCQPDSLPSIALDIPGSKKAIEAPTTSLDDIFSDMLGEQPKFGQHV